MLASMLRACVFDSVCVCVRARVLIQGVINITPIKAHCQEYSIKHDVIRQREISRRTRGIF